MRILQRPRLASLRDTPKSQTKGEKRAAPYPLREKLLKGARATSHPRMPKWSRARPQIKKRKNKAGKENKKIKNKTSEKNAKDPVQKSQGTVAKQKSKRSTPTMSGDAIRVSTKGGQSYADILKEMKAKVDPQKAELEFLSIRRTRMKEVLLVLKKRGDVSAFRNELDRAVGERAEISALVSTRSLEIRDLDETVEKEEVVSVLCLELGRPGLDWSSRLFTRFGGVKIAVIKLAEKDAARLLQLGKIRIG